jgi:phage terminase large subunit-like protein
VFSDLRTAVSKSPTLSHLMTGFEGEIQVNGSPSRAYKVPAVAGTNDGQRPSTALFDEVHEYIGPNRERVHLIIANGCTKRNGSLQLNTTTPGFDKDTLAGRLHDHGVKVNNGQIVDDEFLFVWWGCPADKFDLATPDGLRACIRAANPAADLFLNVEDVAARYHQIPENEWLRYHAAQWVSGAQAWLPHGTWAGCEDSDISVPKGTAVCLGFDGSHSDDSTAIVAVTYGPVPHVVVVDCWERPENAADDWKVPITDVEDAIRQACKRWQVKEIVCDPYRWQRSMQILADEGLPVVEFPQTASRMTPATSRFYTACLNQQLTHSGDPRLARHIANAVLRVDHRGQRIAKETQYSARKIDLAIAAVMAFDRAAIPPEEEYDIMASVL